jgi:hypothetical protein
MKLVPIYSNGVDLKQNPMGCHLTFLNRIKIEDETTQYEVCKVFLESFAAFEIAKNIISLFEKDEKFKLMVDLFEIGKEKTKE